ncbi:hypothetical protein ACFX2B_029107 [Malus domestica]
MDGRCTVLIKKPTTISQSSIQILIHQGCKRNFVVGDTTRAGFGEVDFGWATPVFAGPARCVNMINMYVRHKNKEENGILVLTCLPLSAVGRFQQELKRMTMEPVEDNTKPVRIKSTLISC